MSSAAESLRLLRSIAAATRQHAVPLPRQESPERAGWRGLGVQMGGVRFVTTIGEASEILKMPRITQVPWVKHWVMGLANVRGRLLPVFDVHRLFAMTPTQPKTQWRVLVVNDGQHAVGLAVEQSFGLQYFPSTELLATEPLKNDIGNYVDGAYQQGGRLWYVLGLRKLVADPVFRNVAV